MWRGGVKYGGVELNVEGGVKCGGVGLNVEE